MKFLTEINKVSILFGIVSVTLVVVSCGKNGQNSVRDKTQKGVQAADCIRKHDKNGCNICNRVGLTNKWECPTGVSCPSQSTEKAKENANQCLQVCVVKTDGGGCNLCHLNYHRFDASWGFLCTLKGCSEEFKKDANKCTKNMSVQEFNILTENGFFDSK